MVVEVSPPISLHDDQRLLALQRWQAGWSAAEQTRAAALVAACAQAMGAPMATLGWVDGQSWLPLTTSGAEPSLPPCPRAHTPCAYTVLQPDAPWQVHNLSADPRWAQSPWLQARDWKAYAGLIGQRPHAQKVDADKKADAARMAAAAAAAKA